MTLYTPREDSLLLARFVAKLAFGRVLDLGTGSGIQAITAAKKRNVRTVLAVDVDKTALAWCRAHIRHPKLSFRRSDLFNSVHGRFDTIIFNPPYLPKTGIKELDQDRTVVGGRKGRELILTFLTKLSSYLRADGIALLIFSSLAGKDAIDAAIANYGLVKQELATKPAGIFEHIYVYKIVRLKVLKELERRGVRELRFLTKGHRGLVFRGSFRGKAVVAKLQRHDVAVKKAIANEAKALKLVNKAGIGPKLLLSGKDWFVAEFVAGQPLVEFVSRAKKGQLKKVLLALLAQCYKLDRLGLQKEEMHRPYKHIIVRRGLPVLLDFERTHKMQKPKNVTQLCQFLSSAWMAGQLSAKGIALEPAAIRAAAREYKRERSRASFDMIVNLVRSI